MKGSITPVHTQATDIYMAGALAALSTEQYERVTREIYERVQQIGSKMGLSCYCPHQTETTPAKRLLPSKVWKIDNAQVVVSRCVVAYLGIPSFGVGMEIQMAHAANIPVVLLCERDKEPTLSSMVLGSPGVMDIVLFDEPHEIEYELHKILFHIFSTSNLEQAAYEENWPLSYYRQQEKALDAELNAEQSRAFPYQPISVVEWKYRATHDVEQERLYVQ